MASVDAMVWLSLVEVRYHSYRLPILSGELIFLSASCSLAWVYKLVIVETSHPNAGDCVDMAVRARHRMSVLATLFLDIDEFIE